MNATGPQSRRATARDLCSFQNPRLWPHFPFLPVRRQMSGSGQRQLGLLYDARLVSGTYGFSATVFLVNFFDVPPTEAEFLTRPRYVYDTLEELAADGWVVD
jgi:hypothetical protein